MDYKACLNNIIGITRSDCPCITDKLSNDSLPEKWYTISTSDLYLDELEGIIPLFGVDAAKECDNDELADFFVKARNNAISLLLKDYLIGLNQKFKEGYRPYMGWIASKTFGATQLLNGGFAGIKLSTVAMKGGLITINKVFTMMDAGATFDLYIYKVERNAQMYELVHTITGLQSLPGAIQENTLNTPVELELSEFGADFYLLYQPAGFNPKQNSVSCNCGNKEILLRQYMSVQGVYGAEIPMMPYFWGSSNAMGLSLDVSIGCNASSILCATYETYSPAREAIALAVRYKAGELVHEYVLRSNNINLYTMSSREALYGKRNHFKAEYIAIINWLVDNADIDLIDCYVCNDKRVTKGGIMA
ncbi:MAG: hypothetical protein GXC72_00840 [Chitinophagaceae bacterium]|nr:hypothetical protein [Chitinophagaceae bacterium]